MKTQNNLNTEYYTDPILFKEGWFKDKADEQKFIKRVEKAFIVKNKNSKK